MSTITRPTAPAPTQLFDYTELSCWLNDSAHQLVDERHIPNVKVGHFVRLDPEQLCLWLNENAAAVAKRDALAQT